MRQNALLSVFLFIIGGMGNDVPPRLLELAHLQAGMVSWRRAILAGMSVSSIRSKVTSGRWRHVYPRVYVTFTGPITRDGSVWAALLYAGKGAQLSHETAAELLRLTDQQCPRIHVTIPAERRARPRT